MRKNKLKMYIDNTNTYGYLEDENVNKVPTAILATGLMLLGFGSMGIGILLNTISYRFRENMRQLHKIIRIR